MAGKSVRALAAFGAWTVPVSNQVDTSVLVSLV